MGGLIADRLAGQKTSRGFTWDGSILPENCHGHSTHFYQTVLVSICLCCVCATARESVIDYTAMILPLTKPDSPPLYVELADSLQQLIGQGTLRPGHRVPSVRRMALQRDVSISTVLQAYTVLENRGYLEARPQSGYYVRPRLPSDTPEPRMARPMAKPSYVGVKDLTAEILALASDPSYVPFGA